MLRMDICHFYCGFGDDKERIKFGFPIVTGIRFPNLIRFVFRGLWPLGFQCELFMSWKPMSRLKSFLLNRNTQFTGSTWRWKFEGTKRKKEKKRVCPCLYDSYLMMIKLHNRIDNYPEHSQFEYFCRMCICLCQYGFGETPNYYNRINFKMKIRNLSCMIIISYDAQITKYNR